MAHMSNKPPPSYQASEVVRVARLRVQERFRKRKRNTQIVRGVSLMIVGLAIALPAGLGLVPNFWLVSGLGALGIAASLIGLNHAYAAVIDEISHRRNHAGKR